MALIQAEADLAQAEANLLKAKQDVERLQPLVKEDAAPKQDLDTRRRRCRPTRRTSMPGRRTSSRRALSTRRRSRSAQAQWKRTRALRTAELNLEYATIRADQRTHRRQPDPGRRTGYADFGAAADDHRAAGCPIWVRFKVSESDASRPARRAADQRRTTPLNSCSPMAARTLPGHFRNTVNQVDPRTGTLEVQATFPNPKPTLLPGNSAACA